MENQSMAASQSLQTGLTWYQILSVAGGVCAFLLGMMVLLFPSTPELIQQVGRGYVSGFKFGMGLFGFLSAGFTVGFFFLIGNTKKWLEGVARFTWGDQVNTLELDNINASQSRWLTGGQWICVLALVLYVALILLAIFMPVFLASQVPGRTLINPSTAPSASGSSLIVTILVYILPLVISWLAFGKVRLWLESVTRLLTRRRGKPVSLTRVAQEINVYFWMGQVQQGLILLVFAFLLLNINTVILLIQALFANAIVGLLFGGFVLSVLGGPLLSILLLQWSRVFMFDITRHFEPKGQVAQAIA